MNFSFVRTIKRILENVSRHIELQKYDSNTIVERFRKQGAKIGEGCTIIPNWLGTEPYLIRIGNRVSIADGVTFITHDGGAAILRDKIPDLQVFGPIVIGDNCIIGQNSTIFGNVRIGPNSIVGAGSVVIVDIPANTIAMGVPARPFGSIDKYKEKCQERWAVQRPPDVVLDPGETWWNSRHYAQNREKLRQHLSRIFASELDASSNEAK